MFKCFLFFVVLTLLSKLTNKKYELICMYRIYMSVCIWICL